MARPHVKTIKFRCAFCNVVNPRPDQKGNVKYEVTAIFPPGTDFDEVWPGNEVSMNEMIEEAIAYKFGKSLTLAGIEAETDPKKKALFKKQRAKFKMPIKSSDVDAGDWAGFDEGTYYAKFWTGENNPPKVFDQGRNEITDSSQMYSGCYAWASIEAGGNKRDDGNSVSLYLGGIQKLADGEPFAGRRNVDDDFDVIDPSEVPEAVGDDIPF